MKIIVRCDVGKSFGVGHLSRCHTMVLALQPLSVVYVIKTDDRSIVDRFLRSNNVVEKEKISCIYLDAGVSVESEIICITDQYFSYTGKKILMLDHYSVDDEYQIKLLKEDIKWLQFDSHACTDLYADWVIHGSIGATLDMYLPLAKRGTTKLLVGPKYAIVKPEIRSLRKRKKVEGVDKNIVISFGGGDDHGSTYKIVNALAHSAMVGEQVLIYISSSTRNIEGINKIVNANNGFLYMRAETLASSLAECKLLFTAPGTISYEAACLGVPMSLLITADNQNINYAGWVDAGCAFGLGLVEDFCESSVKSLAQKIKKQPDLLEIMASKSCSLVDGAGAGRISRTIKGDLL